MVARCGLKDHQWFIATGSNTVWDMLVLYTAGHGYTQPLRKPDMVVPFCPQFPFVSFSFMKSTMVSTAQ